MFKCAFHGRRNNALAQHVVRGVLGAQRTRRKWPQIDLKIPPRYPHDVNPLTENRVGLLIIATERENCRSTARHFEIRTELL